MMRCNCAHAQAHAGLLATEFLKGKGCCGTQEAKDSAPKPQWVDCFQASCKAMNDCFIADVHWLNRSHQFLGSSRHLVYLFTYFEIIMHIDIDQASSKPQSGACILTTQHHSEQKSAWNIINTLSNILMTSLENPGYVSCGISMLFVLHTRG